MTGLVPWATLPAVMKTGEGIRVTGVNNKGGINPIDDAANLSILDRLDELYCGFPWESRIWREQGVRRSPYRTLILFGLSARTKDRLLVRMCHDFFRRFPTSERLLQGWADGDLDRIVRVGQKPFIESAAQVIRDHEGVVPRDRDGLKQIKGVGEKIAGIAAGVPVQLLRASLKSLYLSHRPWMDQRGLAMVDLHEIIRLHAQTVCTKAPACFRCPVAICLSRQAEYQTDTFPEVDPASWQDWRELLLEPVTVSRDED